MLQASDGKLSIVLKLATAPDFYNLKPIYVVIYGFRRAFCVVGVLISFVLIGSGGLTVGRA